MWSLELPSLDPFVIQWPQSWVDDPEISPVVEYLGMFLHNLFIITTNGTGESIIEDANIAEKYPWPTAEIPDSNKQYVFPQMVNDGHIFNSITKSINYTMEPFDFVNAKSNSTITFPKYPSENSVIIIRNGDGSKIKMNGNGKKMNGELTGVINVKGTAIEFHYFLDSDEWFAR